MEAYIEMLIMGLIQGVTEFLPVSSSGHLVIGHHLFGIETVETVMMEVLLHAATLIAIIVVYWKTIKNFIKPENHWPVKMIVLATIPTLLFGLIIEGLHLDTFLVSDPAYIACGFLITAALLWFGLRHDPKHEEGMQDMYHMSVKQALWIGCVQGIAILPGISRSGSTISMLVCAGIKRADAAMFSFLMSVPAVMAGVGYKLLKSCYAIYKGKASLDEVFTPDALGPLLVGFLVAMIVGFISLKLLIKMIHGGKLRYFAIYCFILACIVLGIRFFGNQTLHSHDTPPPSAALATDSELRKD